MSYSRLLYILTIHLLHHASLAAVAPYHHVLVPEECVYPPVLTANPHLLECLEGHFASRPSQMDWRRWLSNPFRFATSSVSILGLLLYVAVFTAVFEADRTPSVPDDLGGLDLYQAYGDLHRVS